MFTRAMYLLLGLATGSFIFQVFTDQNWAVAAERTFFQFVALAAFVHLNKGRYVEVSNEKNMEKDQVKVMEI
jgi:hypothetical protein